MSSSRMPQVSVVVIVYNMEREAPRTLISLSAAYQQHIPAEDYEIIVVDNGSTPAFPETALAGLEGNFRIIRIDAAMPSPAAAINRGLREARGHVIGVMIDGARIATPGLLHFARHGAALYPRAVVASLGWYLGSDLQKFAIEAGYNKAREDALLASIGWPEDGYRLFEIGTMDESSVDGWFRPIPESNALFLRRELWDELGGVDERFQDPGGGFLNLDTYRRAVELPESKVVVLLGEGTFHQLHGGTATNAILEPHRANVERWRAEYTALRGAPFRAPALAAPPAYIGILPPNAFLRFAGAVVRPIASAPLGKSFNQENWSLSPAVKPANTRIRRLVRLAQAEFRAGRLQAAAAVARIARTHAPAEPEPQRLLSLVGPALGRRSPTKSTAQFHATVGEAYLGVGDLERAESEFRAAIAADRYGASGYAGLSKVRMPGPIYTKWLEDLHSLLTPEYYVEIGVRKGATLALARPPTFAIGVDPVLDIKSPFTTETQVFPETSDEFFARRRLDRLLGGRPIGLGFIDGLHLFEQALRDFINLEAYCGPRSVLVLHDTFPISEAAQDRSRESRFHTGDIWRTVLCLKHFRPDLDVFTIATPWSGLTVVCGLDSSSRVLQDNFDAGVARFMDVAFADVENDLDNRLSLIPNEWNEVVARLAANGIVAK